MPIESRLIYQGQHGKLQDAVGLDREGNLLEVTSDRETSTSTVIQRRFGDNPTTIPTFGVPTNLVKIVDTREGKVLQVNLPDTP